MSVRRILFVDDEQNVLEGLRRGLRARRHDWEMTFVQSGADAVAAAAETPFDVLVTDMRMPAMNGAELLERFREAHPETARFVLSGQAELEHVMRAVPLAHQYLSKPCEPGALDGVIERAIRLKDRLGDGRCQEVLGEIEGLPSLPDTYVAITEALGDPDSDIETIARIVERDMAMCAKLLQLVNSAFFGLPRQVTDVAQAAKFLGLSMIRDLVLTVEVFRPPADAGTETSALLADLQSRATWTGGLARRMFSDRVAAGRAFTAGVLHDIGLVVYATRLPERLQECLVWAREKQRSLPDAEAELFAAGHGEIGAYLLGLWGLPYPILEAVAYHHRPAELPHEEFGDLAAVHVAAALVEARTPGCTSAGIPPAPLDTGYLERIGVAGRLSEWEEMADADSGGGSGDD